MDASAKCVLRSLDTQFNDVTVWSSDAVTFGRSRDTKIRDKRCSKQQVRIWCSFPDQVCNIEQLGNNTTALNGKPLQQHCSATASHGDVLEVLAGSFQYRIEFDPPPPPPDSTLKQETNDQEKLKNKKEKNSKPTAIPVLKKTNSRSNSNSSGTKSLNEIDVTDAKSKSNANSLTDSKASSGKESNSVPVSRCEGRLGCSASSSTAVAPTVRDHSVVSSSSSVKRAAVVSSTGGGVKRPATTSAEGISSIMSKKQKTSHSSWESLHRGELLVYNKDALPGAQKIAAYDMDGTLITTQSGRVFPTDYNDWKILFTEVPGKLKQLQKDGYKIVIFTNQAGIGTGKNTVSGVQGKITRIMDRLGVPIQVFVATGKSKFRKPATTMWSYMEDHCNSGVSVERSGSVYVGDAAGRPAVPKSRKKDHSSADRFYALNLDVPFQTPEEHFLGRAKEKFDLPEFQPHQLPASPPPYDPPNTKVPANKPELVVMCGFPGSGKSVFATGVLGKLGYQHANRDTLGTWQKCAAMALKTLKSGESVVVDNTNPDRESRARYAKVAKELNIPARCFLMNVSRDHARHNNKFRELTDPKHERVSDMVFNMYKSKYQEPNKSEGFADIVKVNFVPKFSSPDQEKLYRMFLLEK